jgi:hypothetical protein
MKRTITHVIMLMTFLVGGIDQLLADGAGDKNNPNFRYIDNFETGVSLWWTPDGSGSTEGIILGEDPENRLTYRAAETVTVNPHTGSTGSMKVVIAWDTQEEYVGTASHLLRQVMPEANAKVPERLFNLGQALEFFMYGDGSGNRVRLMTRDGVPNLEGSPWINIDWVGWKRIVWDYNLSENVVGWVNGNGEMDGTNFFFDSFQITRDAAGTTTGAELYFDDLRIVDPFKVNFNIADANGTEVISIQNITYEGMQTGFVFTPETFDAGVKEFDLFPGTYQYFVKKDGFETQTGTFEVDDADKTVDINFTAGTDPNYTITFVIYDKDDVLLSDAIVSINGVAAAANDYVFELTPGFYSYEVSKELYFESTGMFTVVDGPLFVNVLLNEIPDVYDNVYLSWDVASTAGTANFRAETYSVWIATVANEQQAFNVDDYVKVFEETLSTTVPNWQYQSRKIEISQFSDQRIRIAFRHFNSSDKDGIVIDNVKVTGVDLVEEITDVLLSEDFEGGVPADFDPLEDETVEYDEEWLPEGWSTIDNDGDEFNWHYFIRLVQGGYFAHMMSKSFDGNTLNPDNWLIAPMVGMPIVLYHNITFVVKDDNGVVITDAIVTFDGVEHVAGRYVFSRTSGTYDYTVTLGEYVPVTGTITLGRGPQEIDIVLKMPDVFAVTFTVDMRQKPGFEPGETDIYITGNFPGWAFAAPGSLAEQKMEATNNVYFFTKTLNMVAGTYQYKYFDAPSFDNAEWPGEDFRTIVVEDDMQVNDVFGVYVSVDDVHARSINIYPNPAKDRVEVVAPGQITRLSVFNLAGQQVYDLLVGDVRHTLDLNGMSNGIYMVRVMTAEGVSTHKLQIIK